jgi:hypothetical protein
MRCRMCGEADAEYIYLDETLMQLVPLCPHCMDEVIHMEGEVNTEFYGADDVEGLLEAANQKLKYLKDRYETLLERYREKK